MLGGKINIQKGCNIWALIPAEKWAEEYTRTKLLPFKEIVEKSMKKRWKMEIFFPWYRSFEVGINLSP